MILLIGPSSQVSDWPTLEQEITIYESLPPHPNLVRFLGYTRVGNQRLRLFMTLYHSTLGSIISKRRTTMELFPPADIANYARGVLLGLEVLHKNSIIHRDLKAHNIFVTLGESGSIRDVSIGDFDVSTRLGKQRRTASSVVGTPYAMAPEVIQAAPGHQARSYTFAVDIFSFGMLLFELLALQPPYLELKSYQVADAIVAGKHPLLPIEVTRNNNNKYINKIISMHQECISVRSSARPSISNMVSSLESICKELR